MQHLLTQFKERGILKTPRIVEAFTHIDRARFVPTDKKLEAYQNYPLAIGHGQTISQPETVAFMLELLQPDIDQTILDIGSGSGWQTALLAYIVGPYGKIYGMEIVDELAAASTDYINTYNYITDGRVIVFNKNAMHGLPSYAPFNRIIAAATVEHIPEAWTTQLAPGGRLVVPVGESIVLLIKHADNKYEHHEYPGFLFVPFI